MEVPSSLKRLLRMVLRGFYEVEHMLVIDLLIRKIYMTEEDVEELIKFEKKQLRNVIAQLRNEKILKARIKMETGPDRKSKKQNYYYINYRGFVNVVKYKLGKHRRASRAGLNGSDRPEDASVERELLERTWTCTWRRLPPNRVHWLMSRSGVHRKKPA